MRVQPFVSAIVSCAIGTSFAFAQTEAQNLQEMRQELQLLKTMMANLERRISAAEAPQKPPASPPPAPHAPAQETAVGLPRLPLTYIGEETRERQVVSDNPIDAPRINNEELDPTLRGYFRLPGTQTLVRLRGFVKTDLFYDLNVAGSWYGGIVPSLFADSPQPSSPNASVSIRPSRFTAEFRQPLGNDVLKGMVEYDLYGSVGRNVPNMRHFYGQYKNFLGGQTWSAFGDPDAWPDTLDFHGPPGMMGLRTPQFRYTQPLNPHHTIGASVEKPGTDIPFLTGFGVPVPTSKWPDFVGFYRYENNYGHLYTAGIFRSVGGFIPHTTIPDLRAHKSGYGLSVSGNWRMGRLRDNIVFQGLGGRGIANYLNDNYGLGSDVGFDANGRLVATPLWSASGAYQHYWTRKIRSSATYGYLRINNTAADPATNYHTSNYASGNIIFQPSALYLFGGEFIYATAERKNDFLYIARRIQLSLQFFFNRYPVE
jgi:hypothetical protein